MQPVGPDTGATAAVRAYIYGATPAAVETQRAEVFAFCARRGLRLGAEDVVVDSKETGDGPWRCRPGLRRLLGFRRAAGALGAGDMLVVSAGFRPGREADEMEGLDEIVAVLEDRGAVLVRAE